MTIFSAVKRLFSWIVAACRILVGLLVMQTGIDLLRGGTFFGYNRQDSLLTGGFIMILGLCFVFSSFFSLFPEDDS